MDSRAEMVLVASDGGFRSFVSLDRPRGAPSAALPYTRVPDVGVTGTQPWRGYRFLTQPFRQPRRGAVPRSATASAGATDPEHRVPRLRGGVQDGQCCPLLCPPDLRASEGQHRTTQTTVQTGSNRGKP